MSNVTTVLRDMSVQDLERVLQWRNHDSVRRFMYTQHCITMEEHRRWFERCAEDPKRHLLIFEEAGIPLGFVNITHDENEAIADWGFYTSPTAKRGTGTNLGRKALRYAFETMELHKLCGQALDFNKGSIRFHEKLGFIREGVLREQHFDGTEYHDIVCFGLLKHEWQQSA